MPNKAYLEITNVCNLKCSFCHGTKRKAHFLTVQEFETAAKQLRHFASYLYFHLMGEPLLHPQLETFFDIADNLGFKVIITTNGTLLKEKESVLLNTKSLYKVSVSLHSFEANDENISLINYINNCLEFCDKASGEGIISVLRLWNLGTDSLLNDQFLSVLFRKYGCQDEWEKKYSGYRIKEKLFLEFGKRFDWPDIDLPVVGGNHSCYGLRDQIGVLCDGTVVPCCLDAEGNIKLGNIFENSLEDILQSEKVLSLKKQLQQGRVEEPLCMRCGFAKDRFER